MLGAKTRVGEGGRLVIPAEYRKALGLKPGDEVLLQEGDVRLLTPQRAVQRAQALVRRYIPEGRGLVDECPSSAGMRRPMAEVVLDASALLALLNQEPGAQSV